MQVESCFLTPAIKIDPSHKSQGAYLGSPLPLPITYQRWYICFDLHANPSRNLIGSVRREPASEKQTRVYFLHPARGDADVIILDPCLLGALREVWQIWLTDWGSANFLAEKERNVFSKFHNIFSTRTE